jgi:uncharacterized HAD superfamily protein
MTPKPANKTTIAVDIDDVIADQIESVRMFHNKHYGTRHKKADYQITAPYWGYWESVWEVGRGEGAQRVAHYERSDALTTQKTVKGALEAMKKLKKNFNLVVVTSRSNQNAPKTLSWLAAHFPDVFDDVRFTSMWGDKASIVKAKLCKQIGAGYLVDDNLQHCKLAAEEGIQPLLFGDYGWNSGPTPKEVIRVKNWQEVLEYFDGK